MGPPRRKKYTVLLAKGANRDVHVTHESELSPRDAWDSAVARCLSLLPGSKETDYSVVAIYPGHLEDLSE